MQFCFHFGDGGEDHVKKAYEVLKDGDMPLTMRSYFQLFQNGLKKISFKVKESLSLLAVRVRVAKYYQSSDVFIMEWI